MSEMALVSAKRVRLEAAAERGIRGARTALDLAISPTRFLSTVQIGITLVGLLTGIYSGETFTNRLEAWLSQFAFIRPFADALSVGIVLAIITFFTLIFGELVPKRIGLSYPEAISSALAPVMKLISGIVHPFVWLLTETSEGIMKMFNIRKKNDRVTEEEIKAIIEEGTKGGEIRTIEANIVERVFALGDRSIASLMTTRNDLVYIGLSNDTKRIISTIQADLHRVYPVYNEDKDDIKGVVFLKDLFSSLAEGKLDLKEIIRPAHFLTERTSAYAALEKFRAANTHYALVTNEYGTVLGIVTLDDVLQALVGGTYEPGNRDAQILKWNDDTWLVDGDFPLAEFEIFFDIDAGDDIEKVNTIAGLVLKQLNHIPKVGEKIHWKGLDLEVMDLDNAKIDKIMVKRVN